MKLLITLFLVLITSICKGQAPPDSIVLIFKAMDVPTDQWEQLRLTIKGDIDEGEGVTKVQYRHASNNKWQTARITGTASNKNGKDETIKIKFNLPTTGANIYQIVISSNVRGQIIMEKISGKTNTDYYRTYILE